MGLNVPRVLAYGVDSNNEIKSPFILQEFISGELLMKNGIHCCQIPRKPTNAYMK